MQVGVVALSFHSKRPGVTSAWGHTQSSGAHLVPHVVVQPLFEGTVSYRITLSSK
jgi:hypothetical protein